MEQRSRSPSPIGGRQPPHTHQHYHRHHPHQHSYPVLVTRRGRGRRLPPTPNKPSTLQLKPANINFPKLNASPTHGSHIHVPIPAGMQHPPPGQHLPPMQPSHCPLSFEQAVAMGRGGRLLPSPVPNGYKPQPQAKQRTPRFVSDSLPYYRFIVSDHLISGTGRDTRTATRTTGASQSGTLDGGPVTWTPPGVLGFAREFFHIGRRSNY